MAVIAAGRTRRCSHRCPEGCCRFGSGSALTQKVVGAEGNLEARQQLLLLLGPVFAVLQVWPFLSSPWPRAGLSSCPIRVPSGAARRVRGVEVCSCATLCSHGCSRWRRSQQGWHGSVPAVRDPGCVTRPSFPQGAAVPPGCPRLEFSSSVCPGGFVPRTAASRSPLRCVIRKEGPWKGGGGPRALAVRGVPEMLPGRSTRSARCCEPET